MFDPIENDTFEQLSDEIHKACPGDYKVICTEIEKGICVSIEFTDPEEATVFRMKGWM